MEYPRRRVDGDPALHEKESQVWQDIAKHRISPKQAEHEIGRFFADHERPSTRPGITYRQFYGTKPERDAAKTNGAKEHSHGRFGGFIDLGKLMGGHEKQDKERESFVRHQGIQAFVVER
ncbi:hypothetical protein [Verrucomicrobium sp. 3C]|uniref:hypothetical protein n=1 Tax=Verrucomicrobium sp. 3C TaxID=1134055 RepID=UPI0012E037AD|nr:hypothetical protein [Verrucomicrobium sp. 3C]